MLTPEQIAFFARNGFIQLERAVAADICAHLVEETWRRLPAAWERADPTSWTGEVTDSCHTADLGFRRGHLKFQKDGIPTDPQVMAGFGAGSPLAACAAELLGADLAPVLVRGLYSIIPTQGLDPFKAPHVESHPIQLVAVGYLADIEPGGGGLYVWPGSHKRLYDAFDSKLEYSARPRYDELKRECGRLRPIELPGRTGDVVVMHHRLFHAPSLNGSPGRIRFSIFCDYRRAHWRALCAQPPGALWEDWAAPLAEGRFDDGPPDFEFEPIVRARRTDEAGATDSSLNKRDASNLARARRVGEHWIVLSDNPALARSRKIEPAGSCIREAASLQVNGRTVESLSHNDIIARIDLRAGENLVEIGNAPAPLWMKIVEVANPFEDSRVICHTLLGAEQPAAIIRLPAA